MTLRTALRQRVRDELNDNGSTKLWGDALINQWLSEAVYDWSRLVGREKTYSTTTVAGQASYALPTDSLSVRRVEHPSGFMRERFRFVGGDETPDVLVTTDPTLRPVGLLYDVYGGNLILSPAPSATGEALVVRYDGLYTAVADDVTAYDLPVQDELALVLYVAARAMLWIGADEAKRQRFERDRGADPAALRGEYGVRYGQMAEQRLARLRQRRMVVRS